MKEKLVIFDTTLRDGEQSPGASMNWEEKVRIARALERMQVDVIEAGFPVASTGDFEAVQAVARTVTDSTVCALSRAVAADIDRAAEALKAARAPRIHTFIASSPIHMRKKLRMSAPDVLARAVQAVRRARNYTDDVEFSPEDATRSEPDFLCRLIEAVIDAGATSINIPDTVGYATPHEFGQLVRAVRERVTNSDKVMFSVHCHNDLGLAVANSLEAVINGARQVECTINGLGERAGNAALEEVVMAVRTRKDVFTCEPGIDTSQIVKCSRLVSQITGFPIQPNKAVVGANAFAHESGIHQDGVLKCPDTYEIMRAEDVGWRANRIVLGKHSGRAAFRRRLQELGGYFGSEQELELTFLRFKELADKKHEIYEEDLQALITDTMQAAEDEYIRLVGMDVYSTLGAAPRAAITLSVCDQELSAEVTGTGPVDAVFQAIESIVDSGCCLQLYSVSSITAGTDAQGEVAVRLEKAGRIVNGQGSDTDIVIASAKAYVHALNKLHIGDELERL